MKSNKGDLVLVEGSYCVVENDTMVFTDGIFRTVRRIRDNTLIYIKESNLQPCYVNIIDSKRNTKQEPLYFLLFLILSVFTSDVILLLHNFWINN